MVIKNTHNAQVGKLGVICMKGCEEMGRRIDEHLKQWDIDRGGNGRSFLVDYVCPRFATGEAKGMINQSVRGYDLYILCDMFNHEITYKMYGKDTSMSPDDHFQDLKRIIAATNGKTRRLTVIMPMLYEGRQHRRFARESLDCAMALQELQKMNVVNIITFDAHDPRVQNAIPLIGFENLQPTYQMIRSLVTTVKDISIDRNHLMIVSPDEGAMSRCIYYASVMGLDLGMFYKRRDYTRMENGRNPIISHEFLGENLKGKDVIVVDDMIASGESMISITEHLKDLHAGKIYIFASFGLFCEGLDKFDQAYKKGLFERVFTTDLVCPFKELCTREWYTPVDMSKYISYVINVLNYDESLSDLLNSAVRIEKTLAPLRT
ncbi:MAG: ribose-phosphate pyrophosphokinase [Oscillospiraceae bacterium]|nr:ribose-phosphate pyrophosphokinase [Oscillospiraceae bacterium]